ncbi:membrane protein [Bacteroidia bacterium]|nr:membrane protein [Bacteroidia bacterium]GHT27099.1 membrane protein [Bacteroidia bacterium]GHV71141.1 membrane protein [Bacteroidia bacterium]
MKKYILFFAAFWMTIASSCDSEFLETHSTQGVDESNIFTNIENATGALEGTFKLMYRTGTSQNYMGYETMLVMSDLMGEDILFGKSTTLFLQSYNWSVHRNVTSAMMNYCYRYHYEIIANVNTIIANIDDVDGAQSDRDYIKGQALVLRAAHYFNLVRMWGVRYDAGKNNTQLGVPLILTLEDAQEPQPQATVEEIYKAINDDLDEAIELLKIPHSRTNKIHPNQSVANGMKARVLLSQGKWAEAAKYAKDARTNEYTLSQTIFTETPARFYTQDNTEWMWATKRIEAERDGFSTLQVFFGNTDAVTSRNGPKVIYNYLYHKISETDKRKGMFAATKAIAMSAAFIRPQPTTDVPAYYNNKYMVPDHNSPQVDCPYMRVAEMYLMEAEGLARAGGHDAEAQQALYDLIITRDPAYTKSTNTGQALIDEIMLHRRIELWGEGFRYFDLKRLNEPVIRNLQATLPNGKTEASNHNASWAQYLEIPAGDKKWQYLFSDNELDNNPHIIQNEM